MSNQQQYFILTNAQKHNFFEFILSSRQPYQNSHTIYELNIQLIFQVFNKIEKKKIQKKEMLFQEPSHKNHVNLNKTISTFSSLCRPLPRPFNLTQLETNEQLLKDAKYRKFLSHLRTYNKKPTFESEVSIIQEKLHEFIYSCLCICNSKTIKQAKLYLEEIDKWYEAYSKKRSFTIQHNKKINQINEEEQIRQTYKSNLPSSIEVYERRSFGTLHKKKIFDHSPLKPNKKYAYGNFDKDSDENSVRIFNSDDQQKDQTTINNKVSLQSYRMEILRMKKAREQKQEKSLLQDIKKNKSKLQSQTSNNFYKPFPTSSGVTIKPLNLQDKENLGLPIFYNTSQGFNQIKRKKLMESIGLRIPKNQNECPKIVSEKQVKPSEALQSVDGINLIKNPFEIVRKTKNKKKK